MTSSISFACVLENNANFFVAGLYDPSSNPMTLLESQQIPKDGSGHYPVPPDTFQVTFLTNLQQNKVYRCILWESPDATPTGLNRVSGDFKPSLNSIAFRGDLFLMGGSSGGMIVGAAGYVDPTSSLAGWNYSLELFGSGTIQPGVNYSIDATTHDWTLIDGTTIQDGQEYILHFQPQVTVAGQPPISAISSYQVITNSVTMTSAYKNKALLVQGAGSSLICGLPALSSLTDFDYIVVMSSGGNHTNALFPTQGTDKILYRSNLTQLVLGQGETMKLFKANGVYNVDGSLPGVDSAGEILDAYALLPNTIQLRGQLLDRTEYARLYAWAVACNVFTTETNWNSNPIYRAFFTQGITGANNFRVPDLTYFGFTRAIDNIARTPANMQAQLVGAHTQATHGAGTITGSGGPYFLSTTTGDHSYSQGGSDSVGRKKTVDTSMRTSDGTDDPLGRVGAENRSNNTGVLRLIRI